MRLLSATMATRANPGGKSMCGLKFPPLQYLNSTLKSKWYFLCNMFNITVRPPDIQPQAEQTLTMHIFE